MAMTSTEMLKQRGLCIGCGDNHQQPGSDYCTVCLEEEAILWGAISAVRSGTANPTVREVMEKSLRSMAHVITGHGATEMSPVCDHCGKASQGRFCSAACRSADFSGRA